MRAQTATTALQSHHLQIARAALVGGARVIQLRDKSSSLAQLLPIAHELRRLTLQHNALLIVNDRVDIALACDADGVHLGPDDMPPQAARRLLGPHRIIGVSCGDAEEARNAAAHSADYIGAGAVFGTLTKADAGAPSACTRCAPL
jgi:thiamine-phosphate pyrophosphorylase